MSMFQCQHCGCAENTALSGQGCDNFATRFYCWTGLEDRKGLKLCSACAPTHYSDGTTTKFGKWHDRFPRHYLPKGMFKTNRQGNLEHVENGDTEYWRYAVVPFPEQRPRKEFP